VRTLRLAILAAFALCAACGQKGALVLPDRSVATPVVIRTGAGTTAPSPPAPPAPPARPADQRDDEAEPPPKR
jgi:predicted small lipoprotein YifL